MCKSVAFKSAVNTRVLGHKTETPLNRNKPEVRARMGVATPG